MTKSFDEALERLAQNDPKLIRLSIFYVAEIGEWRIKKLAQALQTNSYLKELKLIWSENIGPEGCLYLARALEDNYTLLKCAGVPDLNIPHYIERNNKLAICLTDLNKILSQGNLSTAKERINECLKKIKELIPEPDTLPENSYLKEIHHLFVLLSRSKVYDATTQANALRHLQPLINQVSVFQPETTIQNSAPIYPEAEVHLQNLIYKFTTALYKRDLEHMKTMWDNNDRLRAWFCSQEVSLGENSSGQPIFCKISIQSLIRDFPSFLASHRPQIIEAVWDGNSLLRAWFCGQELTDDGQSVQQFNLPLLPLSEVLNNFKSALSGQNPYIIQTIWDNNALLRTWLQGKEVDFGTQISYRTQIRTIDLESLYAYFKCVLSSHHSKTILAIWRANPALQTYFRGQEANFEEQTSMPPRMRAINDVELISNFKAALASLNHKFILTMWQGNQRLHALLQTLPYTSSEELLKKVLSSSKSGNSRFIRTYLKWLNNEQLIQSLCDKLRNNVKGTGLSPYKKRQLSVLNQYVKPSAPSALEDTSSFDVDTEMQPPSVNSASIQNSSSTFFNTKKRRRSKEDQPLSQPPNKKRDTHF